MIVERFPMEQWLQEHDGRATWDLSRSGYYPWTLRELMGVAGGDGFLDDRQRYTDNNGGPLLRELVAGMYPGRAADDVVITSGTTESNWLAVTEVVRPGDEVVVVEPTYQQAPLVARNLGADLRAVAGRAENGWHPDMAELEAAVTARTRLIYVCQPANPTGAVLDTGEIDRILRIAQRRGAWVLSDEIYRGTEHGSGHWSPTLDRGYERVIVTGSLSKTFGLPGLRTGWILGNPDPIRSVSTRREYLSAWVSRTSEAAAALALRPDVRDTLVERCRQRLRGNLPLLLDWAERHADAVDLVRPEATPVAFLRVGRGDDSGDGSVAVADWLRTQASVLALPATLFQTADAPWVRVTYGVSADHLRGALEAVGAALAGQLVGGGRP